MASLSRSDGPVTTALNAPLIGRGVIKEQWLAALLQIELAPRPTAPASSLNSEYLLVVSSRKSVSQLQGYKDVTGGGGSPTNNLLGACLLFSGCCGVYRYKN